MVKSTLKVYKNENISKYGKLITNLKNELRTYKPKRIIPNNGSFILPYVALIMGFLGACRCVKLT